MTEQYFDLTEVFSGTTKRMVASFEAMRAATQHPTTRGDGTEDEWRNVLADFLPQRFAVNPAFVVDSHGQASQQIDLVVHDRHYSPTLWNMAGTLFIPVECVYAVFEVKQTLDHQMITYAGTKAASVRGLHRTSVPIQRLGQEPSAAEPKPILAGLVTTRCGWVGGLGQPLVDSLRTLPAEQHLDLGCALEAGMFEVAIGSSGDPVEVAGPDIGLAMFAMRLVARLNQMGTVPALDYDAYTSALLKPLMDR